MYMYTCTYMCMLSCISLHLLLEKWCFSDTSLTLHCMWIKETDIYMYPNKKSKHRDVYICTVYVLIIPLLPLFVNFLARPSLLYISILSNTFFILVKYSSTLIVTILYYMCMHVYMYMYIDLSGSSVRPISV